MNAVSITSGESADRRDGPLAAVDVDEGEIAWSVSTSTGHPEDLGNSSYQPPLSMAGGHDVLGSPKGDYVSWALPIN